MSLRFLLRLFAAVIAFALLVAVGWFFYAAYLSQPSAGEPVAVTVAEGSLMRDVAATLKARGLIGSVFAYNVFSRIRPSARLPKAGIYLFRPGTPWKTIADTIARGPVREHVTVRIVEGKTLREEADVLSPLGVSFPSFADLAGVGVMLGSSAQPFDRALSAKHPILADIPAGQSLEGYLFPDTYEVWVDALPGDLIEKQLVALESKVVEPLDADRRAAGLSWHEVLTLASIVEAEVRSPEDRKIVAGLFLNRLARPMRLQSDATLNYVIGEGRSRATAEDLALDSPYNTYTNDGLPPGPIGNPSFSAINAVIHPTKTDYLYFLTDAEGKVFYAKTYEEHLRNKEKAYGLDRI